MDLDVLRSMINDDRTVPVRIQTNAGKTLDVPAGAKAFDIGVDTLYITWPPLDPEDPFRVPKIIHLAGVNVSTAELLTSPAA